MAVFAKWLTTSGAYGSGARAIALQRSGGCAQTIAAFDKPLRRDAVLRVVSQLVQLLAEVDQLPEFIHRDGDPEALLACRKLNAGERAVSRNGPALGMVGIKSRCCSSHMVSFMFHSRNAACEGALAFLNAE
jgi:hypothetical protein